MGLERGASPDQTQLVALLLDHPRDFSMAAASLFSKFGRSLRDENPVLFKRVNRMFEDRNKIAHRTSDDLTDETLSDHVLAGREVIAWTNSLVSGPACDEDASPEAAPL